MQWTLGGPTLRWNRFVMAKRWWSRQFSWSHRTLQSSQIPCALGALHPVTSTPTEDLMLCEGSALSVILL